MAGAEVYELGEHVGLSARFGTEGQPVDPPRVVIRLRDPDGDMAELVYGTNPEVVRVGPGSYQVVLTATKPGRWSYRFAAPGRSGSGHEGHFDVFDLGPGS